MVEVREGKKIRKVMVKSRSTVNDILRELGYNREEVVVRLNGKIVAEEEELSRGDSIEVIRIVTGG